MRTLVTGANRGIGLEFVRQLAARGDQVVAVARDPEGAKDLGALAAAHAGVRLVRCDITSDADIAALATALQGATLDLVINNAGVMGKMTSLEDLDLGDMTRTYDINVLGPLRVARAALPALRRGQGKKMIAVTSGMGSISDNSSGGAYAYRASKAALNMAVKSMSVDFAREGLICCVINPGWVQTDMGGKSAPTPVDASVRGMLQKIDGLGPGDTGRFLDFKNSDFAW